MAKILNTTNFSGTLAKVYESSNNIVINGQIYDKNSMVPKAMEFNPIATTYTDLYLNKQLPLRNTSRINGFSDNCVIQDSVDPTIDYVIVNSGIDTDLYKIDNKTNTNTKAAKSYTDKTTYSAMQYIDQDDNFLYLLLENKISSGSSYVCKYDKITLTQKSTAILANTFSTFLFNYGGAFYFSCSGNNNNFSIVKYMISTEVVTVDITDNGSVISTANFRSIPTVNRENYSFYITRHDKGYGGENKLIIKRYVFDINDLSFSSIEVNIDFSQTSQYVIPSYEVNQFLNTYILYEFTSKKLSQYVILMSNRYEGKIYLFKKESANNFILKQVYNLNDTNMMFITYNNNKTLIGANPYQLNFYYFNELNEIMELSNSIYKSCINVGVDKNQGLWLQYSDSSIEYVTSVMPSYVNIAFEKKTYENNNAEIASYVEVYSVSSNGEMVQSNVKLSIYGNAVFTANSLKEITVSTSDTAVIKVPITITGKGEIKIYSDK